MMILALFLAEAVSASAVSASASANPRLGPAEDPRDGPAHGYGHGCQYRKVSLTHDEAALLQDVFEHDPLEGWLTLDGQPCTPSSKFHWHPSTAFPTVTYPPPVEVSTLARVADVKAQKAFLRSFHGLSDVTAHDIHQALHGEVPAVPAAPAPAKRQPAQRPAPAPALPSPVADVAVPARPALAGRPAGKSQEPSVAEAVMKNLDAKVDKLASKIQEAAAKPPSALEAVVKQLDGKVDGLAGRLEEVESKSQQAKAPSPSAAQPWGSMAPTATVPQEVAQPSLPPPKAAIRNLDAKIDKLASRIQQAAAKQPSALEAVVKQLYGKVDGLAGRLEEVESKSQQAKAPSPSAAEPWGSMAPTATVPQEVAQPSLPPPKAAIRNLDAKIDKLASRIQQAAAKQPSALEAVVKQLYGKVESKSQQAKAPSPSAAEPWGSMAPTATVPQEAGPLAQRQALADQEVPVDRRASQEVKVIIAGDEEVTEHREATSTTQSAQLRDISDKIDDLAKTLSKKDLPERQAVKESTSAEAIGQLNARVDGLANRISEVESENTRTRSFETEALPPVGQVQLVNAKADMQQAILTAALGARAQIQGKVDASDHVRAELLHGLNVSLAGAMGEAQRKLQRSEANVAETARKAVDGTLTSILKASMDKVLGVGLAAASLTSEAESLQSNATALLDQVEAEALSGKDAVPRPSNSTSKS
ncbi:for [Symbiodinium sp. CCMP2592]|nr:for [Symbiodinium sp. CCMP2592]